MAQLPTPGALVDAAKAAFKIETDDELRDCLRIHYGLRPSQSVIFRWRHGTEPGYKYALALLDAAGWLNTAGGRRTDGAVPGDPLEALAAAVVALEKGQEEILLAARASQAERKAAQSRRRAPSKRKPA